MKLRVRLSIVFALALATLAQAQYDYPPPPGYGAPRPRRRMQAPQPLEPSTPKGFIAVNYGFLNPSGDMSNNIATTYGGYAQPGVSYSLSGGVPLKGSNFGISFQLGSLTNPFDIGTFTNNFAPTQPSANNINSTTTNNTPYYYEINLMAGLFYTYPVNRFSFDFRAMIGVMFCSLPDIQYSAGQAIGYNFYPTDDYEILGTNVATPAVDIGAGLRYSLQRRSCIMLNVDYLAANPNYSTTLQHVDYGPSSAPYSPPNLYITPMRGSLPINLLNISLGVGIEFGSTR